MPWSMYLWRPNNYDNNHSEPFGSAGPQDHDGQKAAPLRVRLCHSDRPVHDLSGDLVVQAANKTYIMSSYSGSITELYVSEGSYVNEGDLIARLKSTDLDMQKDNLQSQLDIYHKQLDQYNKLLKCIQDDTNYFDEANAEDQPYYYQYQTYKSQVFVLLYHAVHLPEHYQCTGQRG